MAVWHCFPTNDVPRQEWPNYLEIIKKDPEAFTRVKKKAKKGAGKEKAASWVQQQPHKLDAQI